MTEELKFPTVAIQLTTDAGIPIDMPDDWLDAVIYIASMINKKYSCGVDIVYGLASKKGFNILDKEVRRNEYE
ncbi:MAG: hypothetical protein GOVbin556_16 [Prokaryotic dsDNA virus sp.]|nr:MAG: hypothetical protein GOVbin556_16 [Prokaryotic dsDNA virus sp.]|tara:strand:- start:3107 stop:3325 length:219 start_codon:yes stop_codon:yes gene_type:complete